MLCLVLATPLGALGTAHVPFAFQRTYVVGASDQYRAEFTDSSRTDNPLSETITESVDSVAGGIALMKVVVSLGEDFVNRRATPTNSFNSTTVTRFFGNGLPEPPAFPSTSVTNQLFLAMQGLQTNNQIGQALNFAMITDRSTHDSFSGQCTPTGLNPMPMFHVAGDVKSSAGAKLEHVDCTFTIRPADSVMMRAELTITEGSRTFSAKINRTGP